MSPDENALPPILSFDYNSFMENGSMMSREHVLLRLAAQTLVIHSTPAQGRHIKSPPKGLSCIRDKLFHYSNPWYLPEIYRFPSWEAVFSRLRSIHRKHLLSTLNGPTQPVLYLWHPCFSDEIGRYNEQLVVYHVYDDYSTMPGSRMSWKECEKNILRRADIVFVINDKLLNKLKTVVDREYHHLPQGVDFSIFEQERQRNSPPPTGLSSIPSPRVGYIGRVNAKVDIGLIYSLAIARRHWSFIFIGPVDQSPELEDQIGRLKALDNVHFLGTVPFEQIARYWLNLDVAIVPYRTDTGQWAHFGSPLKLREAFAAGKPVIVSPLDDYKAIKEMLRIADSADEWLREIEAALTTGANDPTLAKARSYASDNSWDNRVISIKSLMLRAIRTKHIAPGSD